jgi:chitinase
VAYPTGEFSTESAVYPIETYSASKAADYPAESSKGYGEYPAVSSIGYDSTPSVTKKPEQSQYPTVPAGSTTSVVTSKFRIEFKPTETDTDVLKPLTSTFAPPV